MFSVSDYNDAPAVFILFAYYPVNFFYKGTGGVDNFNSVLLKNIINIFSHAMGTYHYDTVCKLPQFFRCLENFDAPFLQITDHLFIMDNRPEGVNRRFSFFYLLVNLFHRPFDAETKTGGLCNCHIHINTRSSPCCPHPPPGFPSRKALPQASSRRNPEAPHLQPVQAAQFPGACRGNLSQ